MKEKNLLTRNTKKAKPNMKEDNGISDATMQENLERGMFGGDVLEEQK